MTGRRDDSADFAKEQATLFVLGGLPDDEAEAFRDRMAHDEALAREVEALESVAPLLGLAATPVGPPPELKSRLMDRITKSTPATRTSDSSASRSSGIRTQRAGVRQWRASGSPGVDIRLLHRDKEHGRVTVLLRMAPGARYRRHRHTQSEECYVVQGDVRFDDECLQTGDYQVLDPGTEHAPWSKDGCLLLVTSATDNVMLD